MSTERREMGPSRGGQGGMGMGPMGRGMSMGMPVQKAKNFRGTLYRFLGYFIPYKYRLLAVLIAAVIGTVFNIVGPKILGLATTKLFEGLVLKYRHVPGAQIDFNYIAQVLLILGVLYIISSVRLAPDYVLHLPGRPAGVTGKHLDLFLGREGFAHIHQIIQTGCYSFPSADSARWISLYYPIRISSPGRSIH